MSKKTPEEHFKAIYALYTGGATPGERDSAKRKVDAWLKRHGKTEADILSILQKAFTDEAAKAPSPPPSDPRDAAPHPFDDPRFTAAGLVEGIIAKYATMGEHERVIYTLWIILTHVYERFTIAPRIAPYSEEENSGKSILVEIARLMVRRPNTDSVSTGAAITEHIDEGPGTVCADELDLWDPKDLQRLRLIWNLEHLRGAQRALVVKGRRKVVKLHCPIIAAGIGDFLKRTQASRTYAIKMERYTAETKPERDFYAGEGVEDFDPVYSFLRHWAPTVKLKLKPELPPGVMTRFADNAYGLIAIADACGEEWGRRARAAVAHFMAKDASERPWVTFARHGLVVFDALEVDRIRSTRMNKELKRLDLPDAKWTRYCGATGLDHPHPLEMHEQAWLAAKVGIHSTRPQRGSERFRGYDREQFEEALRKHGTSDDVAEAARRRLRLVPPSE